MEKTTKDFAGVLFVGEERICRQVAYVLNIENYEIVSDLITNNNLKFHDYQIYICQFKHKSKGLIKKKKKKEKNIKHLNNICRLIEKKCAVRKKRNKKNLRNDLYGISFWGSFKLKMNHLFSVIFMRLVLIKHYFRKFFRIGKSCNEIPKLKYLRYLRGIKPSKLFLYVLNAPVNKNVNCNLTETELQITKIGEVRGCSGLVVAFGNLFYDGELLDVYQSIYARIIKLSSLNGSYCLCNLNGWCPYNGSGKENDSNKSFADNLSVPQAISVGIDQTCNLCCKSCRNKRYTMNEIGQIRTSVCADKLKRSGYLDRTERLVVAVQGEVFYSPYYRQLLETEIQRESICIFSNGTLFNEENWNWIKDKYKTIDVIISVDAATAETYQNVRGANFNQLLKNLKMLAGLHHQGKIRNFKINFVVQRDNYHEMPKFVELGKSLGVDTVEFLRMNNFGNQSKKQFLKRCMIVNDKYLEFELWQVLQNPIFKDPIVDLRIIQPYIEVSNELYK